MNLLKDSDDYIGIGDLIFAVPEEYHTPIFGLVLEQKDLLKTTFYKVEWLFDSDYNDVPAMEPGWYKSNKISLFKKKMEE